MRKVPSFLEGYGCIYTPPRHTPHRPVPLPLGTPSPTHLHGAQLGLLSLDLLLPVLQDIGLRASAMH